MKFETTKPKVTGCVTHVVMFSFSSGYISFCLYISPPYTQQSEISSVCQLTVEMQVFVHSQYCTGFCVLTHSLDLTPKDHYL